MDLVIYVVVYVNMKFEECDHVIYMNMWFQKAHKDKNLIRKQKIKSDKEYNNLHPH